ncbi:Dabb family protein [Puniceicoccus vermicola]|uniref:Dabb family protein n=1 Tax=Puniceicoccus vermicola TaxID=388746 RepID=A0A7X1E5C6_9BACT|nr:Dabb family protein [Puniceicoccus vermicola]MBC2603004.1 Dabb family protein [Puniceicoccus vermicola]
MIRHLLLIQFKEDVTADQIDEVATLFRQIPEKIEGVVSAEWGANNSPEHKNQGYSHAVLMNFADEAGRENYLPHPEHDALKAVFKPLITDIIVFDYSA